MVAPSPQLDLETCIARLAAIETAAARRPVLLQTLELCGAWDLAERLKAEADRARYRDAAGALRWSGDILALGRIAEARSIVALGRMTEAFTLYQLGRYRQSLRCFDLASALFRIHGDEIGWARTQIGRTAACMALSRFEEALERARQARAIFEREGDALRVASVDTNLALLLERMNRPAEAVRYSERALDTYRAAGSGYLALCTLTNHALLLWRVGQVHAALAAHEEARLGYEALGAAADVAREDGNIGAAHLALGNYGEALVALARARRDLLAAGQSHQAARTSLHLMECFVRMGRFREAVGLADALITGFVASDTAANRIQAEVLLAMAHAGLGETDIALRALARATGVVEANADLASYRATIALPRAHLLLKAGQAREAAALLEGAIPDLRQSGQGTEAIAAQVLLGGALLLDGRTGEAAALADQGIVAAEREGLDWLVARAMHLRGRAAWGVGDVATAWESVAAAARRLDRVQRRVPWDDRAVFASTTIEIYTDAVALALERDRPALAMRYADRSKASALADHLRAHIDVRPRARDERSRSLVRSLEALRARYAALGAGRDTHGATAGGRARWAAGPLHEPAVAAELEHQMAEIWCELQTSNPSYRSEAAALDLVRSDEADTTPEDEATDLWNARLQANFGDEDVAVLEYAALGDDMVLFVVRAGQTQALRLPHIGATLRRLVALLRLNVERSVAALARDGRIPHSLETHARGVLGQLYDLLLAGAESLIEGAPRLVIVPQGESCHVPFHALHSGRGYLIERAEISYSPCASLVEHFTAHHRALPPPDGRHNAALVLAYSAGGSVPHVTEEGRAVVAALGGRLLEEAQASLGNLRDLASSCRVLHLATHGVFRPDAPLFSSLQLADGRLSTLDIFELELRCSLATLSACETALGSVGAGDELMGLSRAFLYAGASSLLLSLWKVEDRSTASLMGAFYAALRLGHSKGAALRQAQLALLRGDLGGDFRAPFYWAPFKLLGHAGSL